jgi:hypothetical protein
MLFLSVLYLQAHNAFEIEMCVCIVCADQIRLTDVRFFPLTFWLLSIICVAYYVAVFPFVGLGL